MTCQHRDYFVVSSSLILAELRNSCFCKHCQKGFLKVERIENFEQVPIKIKEKAIQ